MLPYFTLTDKEHFTVLIKVFFPRFLTVTKDFFAIFLKRFSSNYCDDDCMPVVVVLLLSRGQHRRFDVMSCRMQTA